MRVEDWGIIEYDEATRKQLDLVEAIHLVEDDQLKSEFSTLVFCSHPPVVTLGRGTKPGDLFGWAGSQVQTSRGGRATYHGPNQIVMYPILYLQNRDLHAYLRFLENVVVSALDEVGVKSVARTVKMDDGPSLTGVWVGEKKIASIGIAVKHWITYHGVAINVEHDPAAFQGINPCGFKSEIMTNIQQVLGVSDSDILKLREKLQQSLSYHFLSMVMAKRVIPADFTKSITEITRP